MLCKYHIADRLLTCGVEGGSGVWRQKEEEYINKLTSIHSYSEKCSDGNKQKNLQQQKKFDNE